MTVRVFEHHATVRQMYNLESGLACSLLSSTKTTWLYSGSSRGQRSPCVFGACRAYGRREAACIPWWSAVSVGTEVISYAEGVAKALNVDSNFGEELHHAVDNDPTSETCFVRVHMLVFD